MREKSNFSIGTGFINEMPLKYVEISNRLLGADLTTGMTGRCTWWAPLRSFCIQRADCCSTDGI
jgi:hypothetical protein